MKSTSINTLPDEVLSVIFDQFHIQLPYHGPWYRRNPNAIDTATLYSLCLTSRRLYNLALPVLYHAVPLYEATRDQAKKQLWLACPAWERKIPLFIRTVAESKRICHLVRTASFLPDLPVFFGRDVPVREKLISIASNMNPNFVNDLAAIVAYGLGRQLQINSFESGRLSKVLEQSTDRECIEEVIGGAMLAILVARLPNLTNPDRMQSMGFSRKWNS